MHVRTTVAHLPGFGVFDRVKAMCKLLLLASLLLTVTGCSGGFLLSDPTSAHRRGSEPWWREKAAITPGVKQQYWRGKIWPAVARGSGPEQPLTHIYHSQHYWPHPYADQDEQSVAALTEAFASRGWEEQTTLFHHHFDAGTDQLNRAGVRHLEYVIETVPLERRRVFVQATRDVDRDLRREQSVRLAMLQQRVPDGEIPLVFRNCSEAGRPAAEVETIRSQYLTSTPLPRIPLPNSGRSGATGSASPSGGGNLGIGTNLSQTGGSNLIDTPGTAVPAR